MNTKLAAGAASLVAALVLVTYFSYVQDAKNLKTDGADLNCGFSEDFSNFLKSTGYGTYNFDRPDIKCGAYGGKASKDETLKNIPVIFIHGNSDVGFGRGTTDGYVSWQTGFRSLASFLADKGYQKSEMYTTTWGPANPNLAQNNSHIK